MDFFRSLDKTQQVVLAIVGIVAIILVGTFIYNNYFKQTPLNPLPSPQDDGVTPLDDGQSEQSDGKQPVMALFYTDWCGYCKQTHPAWEEFMKQMDGFKGIKIVKVNCEENPELAKLHGVKSYPTIKLLIGGLEDPNNVIPYQGDRSVESFIEFTQQNL